MPTLAVHLAPVFISLFLALLLAFSGCGPDESGEANPSLPQSMDAGFVGHEGPNGGGEDPVSDEEDQGGDPATPAESSDPPSEDPADDPADDPSEGGTDDPPEDPSTPGVDPPLEQPGFSQAPLPDGIARGWEYIRTNPPFISGLIPTMGNVTPAVIDRYFNEFDATAVHLWNDGLAGPVNSWRQNGDVPFVSWLNNDGTPHANHEPLGGMPANIPGRIGYQVGDEPPNQEVFNELAEGVQVVHDLDPDALLIMNWTYMAEDLLPSFWETAALDWDVDIFSYDAYSTSRNTYANYDKFSKACRQYDLPCWRYLDSYWEPNGHENDLAFDDMRWDAMTGLVFGYVGHTWFIYQIGQAHGLHSALFDQVSTWDANPTEKFHWAAQVNRELFVLGETMGQLKSLDARLGYHWPSVPEWGIPLAWPESVEPWQEGAGGDPYLKELGCPESEGDMDIPIGFFEDGFGSRYVMVQNGRHHGGSWPVENSDPGFVRLVFDFSSAPTDFDRSMVRSLNSLTGQIEHLALTQLPDGRMELLHSLEPGQVLLFKYANGKPFARRMP
jgi:hypothetical protein